MEGVLNYVKIFDKKCGIFGEYKKCLYKYIIYIIDNENKLLIELFLLMV